MTANSYFLENPAKLIQGTTPARIKGLAEIDRATEQEKEVAI